MSSEAAASSCHLRPVEQCRVAEQGKHGPGGFVGLVDVTDVASVLPKPTGEASGGAAKPECRVFREPDGRQSA